MIKTWLRHGGKVAWIAVLAFGLGGSADAGTVHVYANNQNTGDLYAGNPWKGVDGSGWYYNNIKSGGKVGVNGAEPRSGNGSVQFISQNGNSKADISIYGEVKTFLGFPYAASPKDGGALGQLKNLTSLAYDWYRESSSTTSLTQTVALKLVLSNWSGSKTGEFIFEPYYTSGGAVSDQWVHEDILANDGKMWVSGSGLPKPTGYQYQDFSAFLDPTNSYYLGDYYVVGVTAGIGSGWNGKFTGYADNITFGFNGQNTTYNFDLSPTAAVPEPGSIALGLIAGGAGLAAAAWRRRRVG